MEDRLPASAWPTLRQLQFLAALDAHGSFVRAAEVVGVTQPTLSAGIKELETALGVTLVERARSGHVDPLQLGQFVGSAGEPGHVAVNLIRADQEKAGVKAARAARWGDGAKNEP